MIFYVFIFLTFLGKLAFWYIISHTRNCAKRRGGGGGKFLHLAEYVSSSIFFAEREYCCYSALALLCCEIPWSRKTKHEACLILHRVPWGQEVSLLPSWRLWVLYNSVHKGPASHSPVINKWAAVQAKPARVLPLSCHRTCFHMRKSQTSPAWRMTCSELNSRDGEPPLLSCLFDNSRVSDNGVQLGGTKTADARSFVIISVARDFNKMFVQQLELASQTQCRVLRDWWVWLVNALKQTDPITSFHPHGLMIAHEYTRSYATS